MNFLQALLKIKIKPELNKSLQHTLLFFIRYIFLENISCRQNLRFLSFLSGFLLLILLKPPAAGAVSVQLSGTRTVLGGTDCGIATYRFGTNTTYEGQAVDLLVEVLGEDNDQTSNCIYFSGNSITVDVTDGDAADNFAFMDLKITVVKKGTATPVEIDRLAVSGFDLDSTTGTGTDDIYFKDPDGTFISPGSNVTATTGSFFGGQYQTKLKGQASGNCNDSPATGGTIDVACRGAAMFVNGANGPNTVSSVTLRVQNDNAPALRRFQLSFDFSYINQLITNIQDYGDANTSYGVAGTAASANLSLGTGILPDNETTNQFSTSANGDDLDGATNGGKFDDEDAVKLNNQPLDNQTLFTNNTSNLDVATFGTGYLSAWLDFNKDGDFLDAGEKVTNDLAINSTTVTNSSIPIAIPGSATAGNTALRFRFSAATGVGATGFTSTGEVEDYQIAIARYDYGDAPSTFGDAIHDIPLTPTVYLGSVKPDKELSTQLGADAGAAAAGDDGNGTPDDEDAFTTLANVSTVGNYNLTVPVTNTSGGTATLHAWVDFNKNGKFEAGEYKSAVVNNNATSANLNWTVPIGTLPGSTHGRFRLTTDNALTDNSGTTNVDERSLGTASNGEVEDYPVTIAVPIYDYGDAPDASAGTGTGNYQTTAIDGGAAQVKINTAGQILSLGSNIDTDDGSLQNATADADDNNGTPDDEDGIASFPALTTTANQTYTVPVTVSNNVPLLSAYLVGYIDFNKDGDFLDPGEKSTTITVPTSSTTNPRTVNVTFTTPAGMTTGNTYARFRLGQVQATAESATGTSISTDNGEIEDYQIAIASPISSLAGQLVINEVLYAQTGTSTASNDEFIEIYNDSSNTIDLSDFKLIDGNLLTNNTNDLDGTDSITGNQFPYVFPNGTSLQPGQYAVIWIGDQTAEHSASGAAFQAWLGKSPKLNDAGDDVWLYDANTKIIDYMAYGLSSSDAIKTPPDSNLNLWNNTYENKLDQAPSGQSISLTPNGVDGNSSACWEKTAILNTDLDSASGRCTGFLNTIDTDIAFINSNQRITSVGKNNNQIIQDFGDAPAGYEGNNSARHGMVSDLKLGDILPDAETAAQSSANADGDDAVVTPNLDDEDGIISFPALSADATSYSLTVKVNNPNDSPANLYGWLDFDRDNEFDVDERATASNGSITLSGGKVPTGSSGTVTLFWNNLGGTSANITSGNSYARIRLTTDSLNSTTSGSTRDATSINAVTNGEVEDYPIAIAQPIASDPNLLLVKRITAINPGQTDAIQFNNFVDDPTSSNDNDTLWSNSNVHLRGVIDAGKVKPGDVVEYTVYLLSNGDVNAKEVKICDVVPDNMTFVKNTYGVELGIGLGFDLTVLPASPNLKLSNLLNDDQGDFYAPGTAPPTDLCKKVTPSNTLVNVNGTNNDNGAVVVKLPNLPKATAPGVPSDSYGFIRFRAKVK